MMNDEDLIREFIAGNVSAFNTLVWRWEKPVYNFILRYVGDGEQAKDVMQRCFIRAYKSLHDEIKKKKYTTYSISETRDFDDNSQGDPKVVLVDMEQDAARLTHHETLAELLQKALMIIPEEHSRKLPTC